MNLRFTNMTPQLRPGADASKLQQQINVGSGSDEKRRLEKRKQAAESFMKRQKQERTYQKLTGMLQQPQAKGNV